MDERACPSCGAQNAATAAYCWQCFTRFAGAPSGAPEPPMRGSVLRAALGTGSGAGTPSGALAETVTTTRWQPQHEKDGVAGVAVKVLVGLLAALIGFFGYRWLTRGFELPDEIAGQPRMEGDLVEEFEDLIEGFGSLGDVEFQVALYGNLAPSYYLATAEIPEGQDFRQAYQEFAEGSTTATGPVDPNVVTCTTTQAVGSHCTWSHEDEGVVVFFMGYTATEAELRSVAEGLRTELS